MTKIYECRICGLVTGTKERLCEPEKQDGLYDYCESTRERATVCDEMKTAVNYTCGNCGRPAQQSIWFADRWLFIDQTSMTDSLNGRIHRSVEVL